MMFSSGIVFFKNTFTRRCRNTRVKTEFSSRTKRTLVVVLGLVPAGYNESVLVIYPGRIWPDLLDCKNLPMGSDIIELFTQVLIYTTIITVYT